MKKILEYCDNCERETTHRQKRKSYKLKKKGETYVTINLPLKCLVCNYIHGRQIIKTGKKKIHIKV